MNNAENNAHEQAEDCVEFIEDALVLGTLMEVDWANKTARLDRFRQKSVKLRFAKELDEEMRRFATEFVRVEGKGYLRAPDTDKEEWVNFEVESVKIPYQGKGQVFRKEAWLADKSLFDTTFDVDEFNRVIREARHV